MRRPAISRRYVGLAIALTAGAGIGAGSLSACSTPAQPATAPAAATAPAPSTTSSAPSTPAPSSVTAAQAASIAVRTSPGTVGEVEQDVESTGTVFDVKIQHADGSETTVEVDATTGRVISSETDGPDGQDGQPGDGN